MVPGSVHSRHNAENSHILVLFVVDSSRLNYSGKCNNLAEPPYEGQGRIVPINTPAARFISPVGKAKTAWLTFVMG